MKADFLEINQATQSLRGTGFPEVQTRDRCKHRLNPVTLIVAAVVKQTFAAYFLSSSMGTELKGPKRLRDHQKGFSAAR
jgi:hypothetical protein